MFVFDIKKVKLNDMSSFWRGTCGCGFDSESLCGIEVHQVGKAHLKRRHGGGLIVAPNFRMEVKGSNG